MSIDVNERTESVSNLAGFKTLVEKASVMRLNKEAPEFELADQFGKKHQFGFPKDKITVLTFGDRKGAEQLEGWIRPLYERYESRIDISGVAQLSSVPSIFRGIIRKIFKEKINYPVMLDWSGDVSKRYNYQGKKASIYVIDKAGRIVLTRTGAATSADINEIFSTIDRLLK